MKESDFTKFLYPEKMNLPFQKHEEDLWVCRDVLYRGCASANLTSDNIAEQINHILLPLWETETLSQSDEWLTG